MSRSRRKKEKYILGAIPKRYMPFILAGLGALVIVAATAIWLANRPDPNFEPEVTGAPAIEVDQTVYDLGDQTFNILAEVTYTIRNVGD